MDSLYRKNINLFLTYHDEANIFPVYCLLLFFIYEYLKYWCDIMRFLPKSYKDEEGMVS